MRNLTPNQLGDPARGSFIVRSKPVPGKRGVIVAPVSPLGEPYSNAIEFRPVKEK